MRTAILLLALAAALSPGRIVMAQPGDSCAACIGAAECETKQDACVAECRARLFSIDPKRASCVAGCSRDAAQCSQTADYVCRRRNVCR